MNAKQIYRFGSFTLDADERVLLRDREPVTLPPKDLDTLLVLVENAGHIVEKDELLKRVWPGVFIEEGNLARRVFNLRQLLGDAETGRPYIETIPKRGYRFSATALGGDRAVSDSATGDVAPAPPEQISSGRDRSKRSWLWPLGVFATLAITAIFLSHYLWPLRTAPSQKVMLAVLPFENLTGDQSQDYFSDGLTEELTAQLGQLQPAQLGVIARTSTGRYKNTKETVAQIGKELGVGYLLEGSVRRGGDRVRITAQLIRTENQTHLWAETYERPLTDVLNIQREISEKVTRSLSLQLLPMSRASDFKSSAPFNLESYDEYLLGRHDLQQGTRESINKAIAHFQQAISENPKDARLYTALGEAYEADNTYYSSPKECMPRVKAAATQALELDPDLAAAHVLLGDVHLLFDWDWRSAETEYRRALEINPNLPEAQLGYASYLGTLGRFDEALAHVQQAYISDPLAIDSRNNALWIYYFSGRTSDTIEQAHKAIEVEPSAGLPSAMLAMANAQLGKRTETLDAAANAVRFADSPSVITTTASAVAHLGDSEQARKLLKMALDQAQNRYVCRFLVGAAYVELGEREHALESLEEGYLQHST